MGSLFKGNKGYLEHFTLSLGRKITIKFVQLCDMFRSYKAICHSNLRYKGPLQSIKCQSGVTALSQVIKSATCT